MAEQNLKGLRVAILATQNFEESELTEPRKALDQAGAKTEIISIKPGKIQAVRHDQKTIQVDVDLPLEQAHPDNYDAVLVPGGAMNADHLRVEKRAQEFVRAIDKAGKPIAAICHGPWLLVSAGLVKGRKMTSFHTIQDDLRNAGALWEDSEVVRDRNWVSSRKPDDIPTFNREMISLFASALPAARKIA